MNTERRTVPYEQHAKALAEIERLRVLVPDDEENAEIRRLKTEYVRLRKQVTRLRVERDNALAYIRIADDTVTAAYELLNRDTLYRAAHASRQEADHA